jgi:hypothetical protein
MGEGKGMLLMVTQTSQICWVIFINLGASRQQNIEHILPLVNMQQQQIQIYSIGLLT